MNLVKFHSYKFLTACLWDMWTIDYLKIYLNNFIDCLTHMLYWEKYNINHTWFDFFPDFIIYILFSTEAKFSWRRFSGLWRIFLIGEIGEYYIYTEEFFYTAVNIPVPDISFKKSGETKKKLIWLKSLIFLLVFFHFYLITFL